jgi:tetratricopeptide (TPR) repeat protein
MAAPDRRPSDEEIAELIGITRRDPGSPAFVDLGDAYLALGRPRDAVEVGRAGLTAAPDHVEGRLMVARAQAALHQWKEAQTDLLKVVKADRSNRRGFALLGEVLLRRSDYERAIPVLQHAQNLDPANPAVLALLKRARGGQPLDPPAPIPTPMSARRSGLAPPPPPGNEAPTKIEPRPAALAASLDRLAQEPPRPPARVPSPPPAPGRGKGPTRPPPRAAARAAAPLYEDGPTSVAERGHRPPTDVEATTVRGDPTEVSPPLRDFDDEATKGRAPAKPRLPLEPTNDSRPVAAVGDGAAVRPRVIPSAKPVNAAAASLRRSAAVGEGYLNDLLTGGLLDVPGVRVAESDYQIAPGKRWGRSTTRTFIALFVLLVLGTGAGVGWYLHSEQQKAEELAAHRAAATRAMRTASWDGLQKSLAELQQALELDSSSALTFAEVAQASALEHLLYGAPPTETVSRAVTGAARDITRPDQPGYRELVIARAALSLADLADTPNPGDALAKTRSALEGWIAGHADDRVATWLLARARLAAGERSAAMVGLEQASEAPSDADKLVVAMIDRADLLLDDGKPADALALYDQALKLAPDHPLAMVGKAMAQTDSDASADKSMTDLSVALGKQQGPRVAAYVQLWLAYANHTLEYYRPAREALDKATKVTEPRFLARVALLRALMGDLKGAAEARAGVTWYGKAKPESDPIVSLADAELLLASGLPQRALDTAKGDSVRAHLLRGQALLDLGKAKEALDELEPAEKAAPETDEVDILYQEAKMIASHGKDRRDAAAALDAAARHAKTKLGRHAQGVAMLDTGANASDVRSRLEQALDGITEEEPNPVAYRTHTALARLDLSADPPDLDGAAKELEAATTANPGYLPALALRAKVVLGKGDPDTALSLLEPIVKEQDALTPDTELTLAEALVSHKGATDADKADAKAALERAKDGGASKTEIGRIAAMIDPALPEAMGVPAPPAAPGDTSHHHRGR